MSEPRNTVTNVTRIIKKKNKMVNAVRSEIDKMLLMQNTESRKKLLSARELPVSIPEEAL